MKNNLNQSAVTIAYIGGGSLNWATKLMGDLALDGTISAEVRLFDLDFEAAQRNARLVKPHAERQTALMHAALEERREDLFALFLSDPLVSPIGPDKARRMFVEMIAATARYVPQALGGAR